MATGLGEVALVAIKKFELGRIVRVSADVVWMAPLADVALFLTCAAVLLLAGRWLRSASRPAVVHGVFATLAFFTLSLHYTPIHIGAKALLATGLGVQAGRWVARLGARGQPGGPIAWIRPAHAWLGATALLACLYAAVHVRDRARERAALAALPAPAAGPNVLLIIWDTVRAQSLGLYGYERATTPHLDSLASSSLVFERALATAPWTLPTHASVFTGRWPHELSADWDSPLDDTHPTLAEFFGSRGYASAGFVANTFFGSFEHGLNRGFTRYEDYRESVGQIFISSALGNTLGCGIRTVAGCGLRDVIGWHELLGRKSADDVNRTFLTWLDRRPEDRPFFAFLNYFDAHAPYFPPAPFAGRFGEGERGNPMQLERPDWTWTAEQVRAERDAYDGAIAYLDDRLDALMRELASRGLLDETIVVVTSDHGEEFLEHGTMSHSNSLYLPSLHVPLVIHAPGRVAAGRVAEPVSLRDLTATIVELAGAEAHPFPGSSLAQARAAQTDVTDAEAGRGATIGPPASADAGGPSPGEKPLFAEVSGRTFRPAHYPVSRGDMRSVIVDPHHYIVRGDGVAELYDIRRDPWETTPLATDAAAEVAARLRARLEAAGAQPRQGGG
jgi:arylsulfatase A-like enzyme